MAEYIERDAFLAEQRHLYCENCARRKNGKGKFVYVIGDAPCRACGICDVLDAVEDAPAADVRPVVRGKWISGDARNVTAVCSNCGRLRLGNGAESATKYAPFCEKCGAYMREES